jgi:hypothetical protein
MANPILYAATYNGCDIGEVFVKKLEKLAVLKYHKYETQPADMIFTTDDEIAHTKS